MKTQIAVDFRVKVWRLISIISITFLAAAVGPSQAQTFPGKPIRIIVPFGAGGSVDMFARKIGEKLSVSLGQPVYVENRAGAGGELGVAVAARAPADGYTLLVSTNGPITTGGLFRKLSYNVIEDLTPVAMLSQVPFILAVNAELPVKTLSEFIAYAKARPNSINYSNPGNGTSTQLAAELLKHSAGIKMTSIPYKGNVLAAVAVATGEVQAGVSDLMSYIPVGPAGTGQIKFLAAFSQNRTKNLPDVPTVAEAGLPNFEPISGWIGMFVPAKTPPEISSRLNQEVNRILRLPDVREILIKGGGEAEPMSRDQFGQYVRDEIDSMGKRVKVANIRIE